MKIAIEYPGLDTLAAAQIAGYAWALVHQRDGKYSRQACYDAFFDELIKGTELEIDPPQEAWRAMMWAAWQRGAADVHIPLSVEDAGIDPHDPYA